VDLNAAVLALARGGVIAFPTDTVYGLAASVRRPEAVRRIYRIKGRPQDRRLILMAATAAELAGHVVIGHQAGQFMDRWWPGPLTLVVPGRKSEDTVGVRIPDHPLALELLRAAGPLWTTSANRSGEPEALTAEEAAALPDLAGVLDGGRAPGGRPSTVLDLTGPEPVVLREGAIPAASLIR
jgi:L-threonylcarbamoyladenylate synthase